MDNNQVIIIILVVIIVLLLAGAAAYLISKRNKSRKLQQRFGSEYDYTVQKTGDRRLAEEELARREKRFRSLDIRQLPPERREHYLVEWRAIQAEFVNDPPNSVKKADILIKEVMLGRGFPVDDFETRAADVSVLHPNVATNYRSARAIAKKNEMEGATTEELRQAFVHYRSLFGELLEADKTR